MKLTLRTKLAYGLAGMGDGAAYAITGSFLMFFLTTIVGISPGVAGTIAALGGVWEAFCGPIIGYLSDHTETRWGRRKPFIFAAAFPLGVVTCLLFTTIDASYGFRVFYYGLMTVIFWTSFSFFFVPYLSWGAELTRDYDERTSIRTYSYVAQQLGLTLGMVLPTMIVDYLMHLGKTEAQGWHSVGLLVGICAAVSLILGAPFHPQ